MKASTTSVSFAAAAALFAIAATAGSTPALAKHHMAKSVSCYGVNSCKGTSDCKSAHNDCKGMNSCKGQGFKKLGSSAACTKSGGSLTPSA